MVGFAIAFSASAPWIAVMTIGAFFLRQPLKTRVLGSANMHVKRTADRFIILFALVSGTGFVGVALTANAWAFLPIAIAAPLAIQQFVLDITTRGRSLVAELAGAAAITSSVAVAALAAGLGLPTSMALWSVLVGRAIPSILYVRNRLLKDKGKDFDIVSPIVAHVAGLAIISGLAVVGLGSVLTVGVFAILAARAVFGLSEKARPAKAMVIGIWEVVFGVLTVASIIAGHYAGI